MAKNMRTISALKKLCSIGLALIMLVSVFPMSLFTTSAAPAEPKMDGSFESYNLNATPDGWKLLSVTKNGGKGGAEIYGSTFDENYTLKTVDVIMPVPMEIIMNEEQHLFVWIDEYEEVFL